jgi:hypothetical protein
MTDSKRNKSLKANPQRHSSEPEQTLSVEQSADTGTIAKDGRHILAWAGRRTKRIRPLYQHSSADTALLRVSKRVFMNRIGACLAIYDRERAQSSSTRVCSVVGVADQCR